jgi:hypothetical protein
MGDFAARLTETADTWRRAVAPVAEWLASMLWRSIEPRRRDRELPTPLTQQRRREAKGRQLPDGAAPLRPPKVCRDCGAPIKPWRTFCAHCGAIDSTERLSKLPDAGPQARIASHTAEAERRRAASQRRHGQNRREWRAAEQPAWLTESVYAESILPSLKGVGTARLASALGMSKGYARGIINGERRPHPRHWLVLSKLVGI